MAQEEPSKRRRILESAREKSVSLLIHLRKFYSKLDATFLWDTNCSWQLPVPVKYAFGGNSASEPYPYVGRRKAEELYGKVLSMGTGDQMQILGAKGTGKSTAVCSMAGFLQGSFKKRVVYLIASRFVLDPETVLLDALLMSCREEEQRQELLSATGMQDLIYWCKLQPEGSLLFIVDDWDRFEVEANKQLEKDILAASALHMLIKLSSVNSRTREIWSLSDKRDLMYKTVFFDGPFDADELRTWIGQSNLTNPDLKHLDRLTGGMPRLLRLYEQANGNEAEFLEASDMYSSILQVFVDELETLQQLKAAVELVTKGTRNYVLRNKKMTCFYRDEKTKLYHVLSPHLRSLAERLLMERNAALHASMVLVDMQTWIAAVRLDLHAHRNDNPARVGWIMEGVIIAMIRFKQKIFDFEFKHCTTYSHGKELDALRLAPLQHLEEGLLFIPAAFNEQAVDIVYVKLAGGVLVIKGIQITIAQWKAKESHKVWRTDILPRWCEESRLSVSQEFYYVMPEGVSLTDVNDTTKIKSFREIDRSLAEFDEYLLKDVEPKDLLKEKLKTCLGTKRDVSPCQNKSYAQADYWCFHHRQK